MTLFNKIIIPTRPQTDTIIGIFLLKKFGLEKYPGIENAEIRIMPSLPETDTYESMLENGFLCIDIGDGDFDHHIKNTKTTVSKLIAFKLGIENDESIKKMLALAERDDFFGKGTISEDPLDRAFGLVGLITVLNKTYAKDPNKVLNIILPIIDAHYQEELKRNDLLPKDFNNQLQSGTANEFTVKQNGKNLKIAIVESDDSSMSGFLRSINGGRHDVVAQWSNNGYLNINTRPTKRVNISKLAATIRKAELLIKGDEKSYSYETLSKTGKIDDVSNWYYDIATNSILNGGTNPGETEPTKIKKENLRGILEIGLKI